MKTIEERAKEYAEVTTWDDVDRYPSDIYATNAYNAYVAGATEQKAIDNEKLLKLKSAWEKEAQITHDDKANYQQGYHDAIEEACKWIDKYLHLFVMKGNILYPKLAQEFRKAMEE